jgi:hypothetical protein
MFSLKLIKVSKSSWVELRIETAALLKGTIGFSLASEPTTSGLASVFGPALSVYQNSGGQEKPHLSPNQETTVAAP